MPDTLSATDIATLRAHHLNDDVQERPEWGSAPVTSAGASAGAAALALSGLGTGTLTRGTSFIVSSNGAVQRLTVTTDVTIAAGAATVAISPLLTQAVQSGATITPEPLRRSVFNRVFNRQLFSDVALQDLGAEAERLYGRRIYSADAPATMRYRAIELLAIREMLLPGSEYQQALAAQDQSQQGRTELERLERRRQLIESEVGTERKGPRFVEVYR